MEQESVFRVANADGTWALVSGREDDQPFVIRVRSDLNAIVGEATFPNLLQMEWGYFVDSGVSGMPNEEQQQDMQEFEALMVDSVQKSHLGVLVSVNTRPTSRRWLWYCADRIAVEGALNRALRGDPSLPITLSWLPDPSWKFYRDLLQSVGLVP